MKRSTLIEVLKEEPCKWLDSKEISCKMGITINRARIQAKTMEYWVERKAERTEKGKVKMMFRLKEIYWKGD